MGKREGGKGVSLAQRDQDPGVEATTREDLLGDVQPTVKGPVRNVHNMGRGTQANEQSMAALQNMFVSFTEQKWEAVTRTLFFLLRCCVSKWCRITIVEAFMLLWHERTNVWLDHKHPEPNQLCQVF